VSRDLCGRREGYGRLVLIASLAALEKKRRARYLPVKNPRGGVECMKCGGENQQSLFVLNGDDTGDSLAPKPV
jgi:hypothetical protein